MGGLYDELRAALHAVWLKRWIALAVAWALCLAGWLVVSQIPNQYELRARIYVQLRQILPADTTGAAQVAQQKDIDRVRQTLTSAVNLEKVVRGTELANTVSSDRDVADRVGALQKIIKVTAAQDNLFEISATLANPGMSDAGNARLARSIVQKMIDIFVDDNITGNRDEAQQSLTFLDQQLEARQQQLQTADAKRADFQARFLGSMPGTGSLNDRVEAARNQLAQVNSDLASAQSGLSAVNGQMAGTPASVPGQGGALTGPARARVAAIQGQLAEARGRGWTDNHPDVVALKAQLAQAQTAARGEPLVSGAAGANNPLYLSLKSMQADRAAQVAALTQRKGQIEGDLQRLQDRMTADPAFAAEQATIDRDYQVLKDQYNKLLGDREQVRLRAQAQDQGNSVQFRIVDPPGLPRAPKSPNRPLLLTGVLLLGLCGGIGVAFGLGQLRPTFSTAGKLERASGMPVIGAIGQVLSEAQRTLRRRRLRLFASGTAVLVLAWLALLGVEFVQRGMIA